MCFIRSGAARSPMRRARAADAHGYARAMAGDAFESKRAVLRRAVVVVHVCLRLIDLRGPPWRAAGGIGVPLRRGARTDAARA